MKERVYLYTRVSTLMQTEGYSLEAQRQKILDYAKYRDFVVAGEYSDAGFSGKNIAGRAQFQQMLADIESKKDDIKYVLVFKLSRFGRNCADTLSSLQFMQDYGVNLICVDDNLDSSAATGKLMISVMSAMAEIERENILSQTMAGRKQKAKDGGWNGGQAPYGYRLDNGQLIVQEDEAEVVREIYNLFVNTAYGPSKVAKEINKKYKKIPRANGYLDSFTMALVKDILDNPVYTGRIAYGRHTTEKIEGKRNEFHIVKQTDKEKIIIAEGQHEAIVSLEVWEAAQEKRKANAKTKEKIDKEHEYFLSGLLKCPSCGGPMYGIHNGRKKKKDGTYYPMSYSYACRSSSLAMGRECTKPQNYSENKLMDALTAIIKSLVNDKNFDKMVDVAIGQKTDVSELEKEKALRQKELERLNRLVTQLENQLNALDYSSKAADLKEKSLNKRLDKALEDMEDIQIQLADLDAQMEKIAAAEETKKQVYGILQSFDVLFDIMDNADRKLLIKELIEKIELYPRQNLSGQWIKTIHFRFPMYYNDNNEASCAVCFDLNGNFLPKKSNDESIVCLSRENKSPFEKLEKTSTPLLYRAAQNSAYGQRYEFESGSITDAMFVYLDGSPSPKSIELLDRDYRLRPLVCLTSAWEEYIKKTFPNAYVCNRYMMKPSRQFLTDGEIALPDGFQVALFDEKAFALRPFSHGENYPSFAEFQEHGAGAVVWHNDKIVASASSFITVNDEIELDVSTEEAYRGKGLASACISLMLQDCAKRGIIVHWDAQNDTSLHLAEKLGFEQEFTYSVYFLPKRTIDESVVTLVLC